MRTKYYSLYANAIDNNGETHVVTVVGELITDKQTITYQSEVPVIYNDKELKNPGTLVFDRQVLHRKLTLGIAICNPADEFNEEYGISLAKARIKKGFDAGILETNSVTMLTEDQIYAQLFAKLKWVCDHIEHYLPENNETFTDEAEDSEAEDTYEITPDPDSDLDDDTIFGGFDDEEIDEAYDNEDDITKNPEKCFAMFRDLFDTNLKHLF